MSGNKHFVRSEPRHRLVWALAVRGNEFASSLSSPMTEQKLAKNQAKRLATRDYSPPLRFPGSQRSS